MSRQAKKHITPEEYLDLEREAEYKNEYFAGEVFAMVGASRKHNLIAVNLLGEMRGQLKDRPCEVYPSDVRVRIPSANIYTYPDVTVVCGAPEFEDNYFDTLLNPTLIAEVLSKSTAAYDRFQKFGYYRSIDSLAEYLLVAQSEYRVEQYTKQPDGRWLLTEFRSPEDALQLDSIGCSLSLKEIYDKVSFS